MKYKNMGTFLINAGASLPCTWVNIPLTEFYKLTAYPGFWSTGLNNDIEPDPTAIVTVQEVGTYTKKNPPGDGFSHTLDFTLVNKSPFSVAVQAIYFYEEATQ